MKEVPFKIKAGDIICGIDGQIYKVVPISDDENNQIKTKSPKFWNCCAGEIPSGEKCRICGDSE